MAVFYGGTIVEEGPVLPLFDHPQHPYTQALLRALPRLGDPSPFEAIPGTPVQVLGTLDACPFAPRCVRATDACHDGLPAERADGARRHRCLHPGEAAA